MKILISAAEASSDVHGAQLLRALRRKLGDETVEAFGVGGPRLQAEGLRAVVDARSLLAMGFTEILGRLPGIFRALSTVAAAAAREKPDVAVVIDYPDFHFRLAKRIQRLGIPVVYFIPPKVWVWRQGRVRILRDRFAQVLCILPFEDEFYRNHAVPVKYVGNPLVDELPLDLTLEKARDQLGLALDRTVVLLMPGSRPAELDHHLELMLEAVLETGRDLRRTRFLPPREKLVVLLPFSTSSELEPCRERAERWMSRTLDAHSHLELRSSQGDAHTAMAAADAGLIKSGTSTLEAALMGCPHAILYRSNLLSHLVFEKVVRRQYRGPIGLSNLIHGWSAGSELLIREFIDREPRPRPLSRELTALLTDRARREQVLAGLRGVREKVLGPPGTPSPSEVAADEVIRIARAGKSS